MEVRGSGGEAGGVKWEWEGIVELGGHRWFCDEEYAAFGVTIGVMDVPVTFRLAVVCVEGPGETDFAYSIKASVVLLVFSFFTNKIVRSGVGHCNASKSCSAAW